MKLSRVCVSVSLMLVLASVAYVAQSQEPAGLKMADAAEKFLASISPEQKQKLVFDFDDAERFNWHFIPLQDGTKPTRKGLRMEELSAEQQAAARDLIRAGTSDKGYAEASTIMSLENLLKELEKGGAMVRNPGWYFFTVYGTPSKTGKWGWRVEGHHLSLNFTLDGGKVISSTPAFFGANPANIKDGAGKGKRTLAEAEDLAKELFKSLDDSQKQTALQKKHFREIEGKTKKPSLEQPEGLSGAKMTQAQRDLLTRLLRSYANRMPADVSELEWQEVKKAGEDQIYFAYSGSTEEGQPHTYRIQGPTFVVEFLNIQADSAKNPANHIHSVWRRTKGDFGLSS